MIADEVGCLASGGEWHPEWDVCDPNPCPQPDVSYIGLFRDEFASICYQDLPVGVATDIEVFAILDESIESITVAGFRIDNLPPTGEDGIVTEYWNADLTLGNAYDGIVVAFTTPVPGPVVHLGRLECFMINPSWVGDDHQMTVMEHPDVQLLYIIDGNSNEIPVLGGQHTFNCTDPQACPCLELPLAACCFDDGSCVMMDEESCIAADGGWHPEWGPCEPVNPCPAGSVDEVVQLPTEYRLYQCFPNPFNPRTTIRYDLPEQTLVRLEIFDVSGRLVRKLVDSEREDAGRRWVVWDGTDDAGRSVSTGIYSYKLITATFRETRQMVLLK
jgi:hypothetical protein